MKRAAAVVDACAVGLLLPACFTYVPADLDAMPPGQEVRIYLTRSALADLPETMPANGQFLRGRFMASSGDSLTVRVSVATLLDGFMSSDLRQDFKVPADEVLEVERRQFNRARTGLLVLGAVGAAAGVLALITDTFTSRSEEPEPPVLSVLPLFSVPIRLR